VMPSSSTTTGISTVTVHTTMFSVLMIVLAPFDSLDRILNSRFKRVARSLAAQNHRVAALNGKMNVIENAVLRLCNNRLRTSFAIRGTACWLASELAS